jgi:transcriptional regulator with XRE-family HTH domain
MAHCFDRPLRPEEDLPYCGRVVRAARHLRGLTMKELSTQAGCSRGPLNVFEPGHSWPQLPHFVSLCRKLHLSMDALFGLEADPTEKQLFLELRKRPGMAKAFLRMLEVVHPVGEPSQSPS